MPDPSLLARAFAPEPPGPPLPPGPPTNTWTRAGALPVLGRSAEAVLLADLWGARGHHLRADGTTTAVPCRAVPSAGAAYPVQWHVLVPAGTDSALPPGRYALGATGLLRRPGPVPAGSSVALVVSVQPGRSFGRYRHRAWPLWVADAAYAVEAVRFVVPGAEVGSTDLVVVREALGVARAGATDWWLGQGLVPELALARVDLPGGWAVDPLRRAALGARRSPALARFAAGAGCPEAREPADQSGQAWVRGATRVRCWARPALTDYAALWRAHREAARECYAASAAGLGVRPVSGFVLRAGGPPLLHALAMLEDVA
ncbi:hypothetical protein [Nocardioides sp. LML1-1-1.1]|uniref:hypothetical protein n=1 Tax=Nocardioides sp. LML1-1-1.1 TaxID=3135248 RepID=UPI003433F01B